MANILRSILEGGERSVVAKFNAIIEIGLKASNELDTLIKNGGGIEGIKQLEKRSDIVAFNITNMITSGGVAPNLIDNMLELAEKEDNIIDSMYNLARELLRYNVKGKRLSHVIKEGLERINKLTYKALLIMKKMHNSDSLEEIKRFRSSIEKLEEEGDEIKDSFFDLAYRKSSDFKTFYHIIELFHKADDMLDNCEDSSDIYLTIMSSIIS
ncbi:MAG: DUF47 domain-containing protein [Candidatus Micrarchaeia archaeon]